jgi:hypothetical protein
VDSKLFEADSHGLPARRLDSARGGPLQAAWQGRRPGPYGLYLARFDDACNELELWFGCRSSSNSSQRPLPRIQRGSHCDGRHSWASCSAEYNFGFPQWWVDSEVTVPRRVIRLTRAFCSSPAALLSRAFQS